MTVPLPKSRRPPEINGIVRSFDGSGAGDVNKNGPLKHSDYGP